MNDNYTYITDLVKEVEIPKDGILSRILLKNSQVNVTIFGFDAGQELSEHTAGTPAIVQILKGGGHNDRSWQGNVGRPGRLDPYACSHSTQPPYQDTCGDALAVVEVPGIIEDVAKSCPQPFQGEEAQQATDNAPGSQRNQ
jgi:hypothetical protein